MRASVILATLCFFWMTSHTSPIRAEETWKKVEVGPVDVLPKLKHWDSKTLLLQQGLWDQQ